MKKHSKKWTPADHIRAFANAILHGDEWHKAWLLAAAEAYISGEDIPKEK